MTSAKIDLAALARRDAFCADLGIELVESSPGRAVTKVTVAERHLNFLGSCHGGLTFTLADAAFGFASNSHGQAAFSIDSHMIYNRAVKAGEVLTATAVEISRSSKLAHYRVDVVRGDGKLVAGLTGTAFANGAALEV
jgi:acyl-CoA thioesterase